MTTPTICIALIAMMSPDVAPTDHALETCRDVVTAAESYHLPPSIMVSVAWHESRLRRHVVHPESGAAGPLQVMPLLQSGECLIDDGARVFRQWLDHEAAACVESPTVDEIGRALCRYACGYRCSHPCRWSTTRMDLAASLAAAGDVCL